MEDSEKVIEWSIENSEALSLKAEFYTGIHKYLPNIVDVGISIRIDGKSFYGRGTDYLERVAYCKAFSEAIERAAMNSFQIENSNGLAVHYSIEKAKKNAKYELLERDAFLCKFLLNSGLKKINSNFKVLIKRLKDQGIDLNFFEMCRAHDNVGILCVANGGRREIPFGSIIGTSYDDNYNLAEEKSLIEVLRTLSHLDSKKEVGSLSEEEFLLLENINFSHHGQLALNIQYSNKLCNIINNPIINVESNSVDHDFTYECYDLNKIGIQGLPLFLIQAKNSNLQQLYVGKTEISSINLSRLKKSNEKINFENINTLPHPFD